MLMYPPVPTSSLPLTRSMLDHIVVSVGPYMFHTSPLPSTNCLPNCRANPSPPLNTLYSPPLPHFPLSTSSRHIDGVACITVLRSSRFFSSTGSSTSARLTT